MKNFRWILLAGLLVTAPQLAHAQPPSSTGRPDTSTTTGQAGQTSQTGITNDPSASAGTTTTTTTTTAVAPDDTSMVPVDDAATGSTVPNTGGEPMLVALAGLSIAAMAFGLRRKVTA